MTVSFVLLRAAVVSFLSFAASSALALQFVVGQVAPLSGLDAKPAHAYAQGMRMHFDFLNRAGGINGNTIVLVQRDDRGLAADTVSLTQQLIQNDRPIVLAGYFGRRNIAELIDADTLRRERIALVGYRTAAEVRAGAAWVYSTRAGLNDELSKLAEYLKTIGLKRVGLLYEDGPDAQSLLKVAEETMARLGLQLAVRAPYSVASTSMAGAVKAFLQSPPQAIVMVSMGAATASFIEAYRLAGGTAQLLAHSGADFEQLSVRLGDEHLRGVVIAQVTPNPYRVSNRITKEFNDAVKKTKESEGKVSYAMMEGYITAQVIAEALRRQGRNPSRAGMAAALDGMRDVDLGGYVVDYASGPQTGSSFVELSIVGSSGRIRQ